MTEKQTKRTRPNQIILTCPPEMRALIDAYCEKNFMTRSEFLRQAARELLEKGGHL